MRPEQHAFELRCRTCKRPPREHETRADGTVWLRDTRRAEGPCFEPAGSKVDGLPQWRVAHPEG